MQFNSLTFHFIGIGGVGMSGLAELLHNMGATVTGSDLTPNTYTKELSALGVHIFYGHSKDHIGKADVVVFSSSIKNSNPEIKSAKEKSLPLIQRAEMLAELMRFKRGIAIGGTHGKTTTTSLLASVFLQNQMDPTIVVGGRLNLIKSTSKLGQGEWLIAEADESDRSFLKLSPEIALITNIDNDHLDQYDDFHHLKQTFLDFALKIPFYGFAMICGDDPSICDVFTDFPKKIRKYGFHDNNDYQLKQNSNKYQVYLKKKCLGEFQLNLPGHHNALNACAAFAVGVECGLEVKKIIETIEKFVGVERRFQLKGEVGNITIYDDYGHHPTEIQCMIQAFKKKWPQRRLVIAFQPHKFSRTKLCWKQFQTCFEGADKLLLFDIYPAGEDPIDNITSSRLFNDIDLVCKTYIGCHKTHVDKVANHLLEGDIFLTLGAGDIYELGEALLKKLSASK